MKKVAAVRGFNWSGLAEHFLSKLSSPFLDWIQVEVTSHCNAECVYCPHTIFRNNWQPSHMPIEIFEKLLPAFRKTDLVYLQGWGEPLLHPRFFEMVRSAKECGCQVGTTTNGVLCDEKTAELMVGEGLHTVAFSLAGTTDSQDGIRCGTRLKGVLNAVRLLEEQKEKLGSALPNIHVAYLWLRSEFDALKELPALMEGAGVGQVVVTTLDFVARRGLAAEVIKARDENEEIYLRKFASEVIEEGERRGVKIVFSIVSDFRPPGACTENVNRALFVSSRGHVSPCVFRNLPVSETGGAESIGVHIPESLTFGDIDKQKLSEIWAQKAYKTFRADHAKGRSTSLCDACPKLFASSSAEWVIK